MIELWEQYGYNEDNKHIESINLEFLPELKSEGEKFFPKKKEDGLCFKFWKATNQEHFRFQTSYFVGVDWIEEGKPIYVAPKQNNEVIEIDYLKMLMAALNEETNLAHLEELVEIDFEKPFITIKQSQDLLTPLLIYQYLKLLKKIVQKGLRKSYYKVDRNLNSKVKGKILINQTIKQNLVKSKNTYTVCRFEEYGVNSIENKLLKKAFEFSFSILSGLKGEFRNTSSSICSYINPGFEMVDSEVNILELKHIRPNPLFPEYEHALKLAKIILRKYGYAISKTTEDKIETPPFWIDMSKLFELYVHSKLKKEFTESGEIIYHPKIDRLESDFLLKSQDGAFKMVVDAKYKPRYENNKVSLEDIRQVSGYARMKGVYDCLGMLNKNEVIDCLIIYSSQSATSEDLIKSEFRTEEQGYVRFYKVGIKLPQIT